MAILKTTFFLLALALATTSVEAARLKDIADIEGVRGNQLVGYGLVVGLNGTGDGKVDFTTKSISNLLERAGLRVDSEDIKVKNVAAVMVTATLPAFARPGSKIDVTLSSMGDAKSLQGGNLIFSPLKGADGNVYAVAQGAVNVGGFSIEGGGDQAIKNHPTVGQISGGASVERAIPFDLFQSHKVRVTLREADFTTTNRLVSAVNSSIGRPLAVAVDGGTIEVAIPPDLMRNPVALMSKLELIEVQRDIGARVVVNEKTGTIIMGETVTLSRVALAHGNLNIAIRSETGVSQPNALADGTTQVVTNTDVNVGEEIKGLSIVGGQVTLGEVVKALNALGATPRDLISIFQALKRAGALNADLIVM
jgi:flagellar P-ring protein precursor FlgI